MKLSLRFLGVGSAQAVELGSAGAVLERNGEPLLLIDCGPETLTRYLDVYASVPRAIYITHTHMDHVGGLERLFYRAYFDPALIGRLRIYAHAALIPHLQSRVADYPNVLAEGGANFWDAFQLIALSRGFWHEGLCLRLDRRHASDSGNARAVCRRHGNRRPRLRARRQPLAHRPRRSGSRISGVVALAAGHLPLQ
jgi:hypothetical protein